MAIQPEYRIEASSRRCCRCGRVFEVRDEYYSAVVESDGENPLLRQDFCLRCWTPDESYFSFWKTRVPEPKEQQRGPRLVNLDRLMRLFERLKDAERPEAQRFRYVLALALMRKRRLKMVESRRLPGTGPCGGGGQGERLTVRETGSDRTHTVTCPSLSEDEIRSVTERLREILDMPEQWEQPDEGDA